MNETKIELKLGDVSNRLGVSKAWINKVQDKISIPKPLGKKGQKTVFNEDELEKLKNVRILRLLDFSFGQIKALYDLEAKACNSIGREEYARDVRPEDGVYSILLYSTLNDTGESNLSLPQGEGKSWEYNEALKGISQIHEDIRKRAESIGGELINLRCKCRN